MDIMKFWKDYTIKDTIIVVKKKEKTVKAIDSFPYHTPQINSHWRKLCPDVVHHFTGFTEPIKDMMKKLVDVSKKVEGFKIQILENFKS